MFIGFIFILFARHVNIDLNQRGREKMCEAVEEYAKEYAVKQKVISVQNLMENMKLSLEQALNALGIQGDEQTFIISQLQK